MLEPRQPAVAGRFYPADPAALAREVEQYLRSDQQPISARALIGPHAGFIYSGAILGETYARVEVPSRVIVMCPNHTGKGARRSLWSGGAWALPGDSVPIDGELADRVQRHAKLSPDEAAHLFEHAIEVHLPFVRARRPDAEIVPICLSGLSVEDCREVGEGIAAAIRETTGEVLIAASTDMSHYISADDARALDGMALDRVQALDPEGLYQTVRAHDISMCGFIPTTVALFAAIALGTREAELVRYGNSGERSGDYDRVVGYAGLVVR